MTDQKIEKVSVALSPFERKIVEKKSDKHGLNNFSSALRMIIREWDAENKPNGKRSAHWVGKEQPGAQASVVEE